MTNVILFILESNLYLALFLLIFQLFLRKEPHFSFNRFFLLFSIVFSLSIPQFPFELQSSDFATELLNTSVLELPEVIVSTGKNASSWMAWFVTSNTFTIIAIVYLGGFLTGLFLFALRLKKLLHLCSTSTWYRWRNCRIAEPEKNSAIFSFFNFICIGNGAKLSEVEKQYIKEHELVHVRQLHTIDLLITELLIIFYWFNPLIKVYKKKLIQQHEFEADSRAAKKTELNDYCNLLARIALQAAGLSLANHFNNSLTIKRITMMQTIKKKTNKWKIAGLILIFPAIVFLAACQRNAADDLTEVPMEPGSALSQEKVHTAVDHMPEFPGGFEKLGEFLGNNLKYPQRSAAEGIEGTTYIAFVVDEQGNVTNPKVFKGFNKECDEEALRVVSISPKWIPAKHEGKLVKVEMKLPIKFEMTH